VIADLVGRSVLAALLSGVALAGVVSLFVPPTRRLAPRVRPYTVISRTSLGRAPDVVADGADFRGVGANPIARLFGPILGSLANRIGRVLDSGGDAAMVLKLKQAALFEGLGDPDRLTQFRVRQLAAGATGGVMAAVVGRLVGLGGLGVVSLAFVGIVAGIGRHRGAVERAVDDRRARMRIEIYTVNQLLAMHIRVGGGVTQAVQELVNRGAGDVIGELAEAARMHRSGMAASEAFERLARLTPEPYCARTYSLLAAAEERGSDLGDALLALAEDVRESRRESMKQRATKQRAAMLIPTIAILAPVLLVFVAAPLPSIIFGTF